MRTAGNGGQRKWRGSLSLLIPEKKRSQAPSQHSSPPPNPRKFPECRMTMSVLAPYSYKRVAWIPGQALTLRTPVYPERPSPSAGFLQPQTHWSSCVFKIHPVKSSPLPLIQHRPPSRVLLKNDPNPFWWSYLQTLTTSWLLTGLLPQNPRFSSAL